MTKMKITDLVEKNTNIKNTKDADLILLRKLMSIAVEKCDYDFKDIFNEKLFIDDNQDIIIKKLKKEYETKDIKIFRRILSKLIFYLGLFDDIMENNYYKYTELLKDFFLR